VPGLTLGGWANPHANADAQAGYLADEHFSGDFYLTQIVSHHDRSALDRFQAAVERRRVTLPGVFGLFYYRSANPKTLAALKNFLPVPVDALTREFGEGASPEEICARSLRALRAAGARHCYVSNLPVGRARQTLEKILALASHG
jgi:hypothetical protein